MRGAAAAPVYLHQQQVQSPHGSSRFSDLGSMLLEGDEGESDGGPAKAAARRCTPADLAAAAAKGVVTLSDAPPADDSEKMICQVGAW